MTKSIEAEDRQALKTAHQVESPSTSSADTLRPKTESKPRAKHLFGQYIGYGQWKSRSQNRVLELRPLHDPRPAIEQPK